MNDAHEYLTYLQELCHVLFNISPTIELVFDLKGCRTLGQCRLVKNNHFLIRLHAPLLEKYQEIYLEDVLTHEMAHVVQFCLYKHRTKPHGREWKEIMKRLEGKLYQPRKRPTYDTTPYKPKKRKMRRFKYACLCEGKTHTISAIRHYRMQRGTHRYHCLTCKYPIIFMTTSKNEKSSNFYP